jgi:hypothetical protein
MGIGDIHLVPPSQNLQPMPRLGWSRNNGTGTSLLVGAIEKALLNLSIPFIEIDRQIVPWIAPEDFARSLIYP